MGLAYMYSVIKNNFIENWHNKHFKLHNLIRFDIYP